MKSDPAVVGSSVRFKKLHQADGATALGAAPSTVNAGYTRTPGQRETNGEH